MTGTDCIFDRTFTHTTEVLLDKKGVLATSQEGIPVCTNKPRKQNQASSGF